ncbi:GTP-binding protein YchF [Fusarium austroafricanum]|uniref:Obg-like ATPase homolog n=1 Tax=Fusarium austroafricanum TaxID=2364996 RepID=A0A8H4KSH7_9HYPO|nr:GTP-binding protein YchF [Fusarium austroafricanum]
MAPKKGTEPVIDNVVAFGRVRKNLKMGCVGLPNVGKSSLFNLLTEQSAAAENYPFCTIEPNEARCAVPDARYDFLCDLWKPPSMYPAYLQVTDIAGLIKGASEGQGLGNAFLSHIQAVDGMYHIVRAFDNDQVLHVDDSIDPVRDLDTIQSELCKKDLDILDKQIVAEELIVKKAGGKYKMLPLFYETTTKIRAMLEQDKPVRDGSWTPAEIALINEKIQLITTKPVIYLVNLTMKDYLRQKCKYLPGIAKWVTEHGGTPRDIIPFSIEFEEKLHSMKDDPDALAEFMKEIKVKSKLDKIITEGFTKLGLQYYFTAGEKEIRCWTIPRGCLAPQAAGAIHSDFERGFIKAEVVAYQDFHDLCEGQKSMGPIKAAGKYRQEGKSYVVQDGDIIHFQFTYTMQASNQSGTPAILVNDQPAGHGPPSPQSYTYQNNGLVPIHNAETGLGELLRDYRVEEGINGPFWTEKLLRHILTRQRIESELQKPNYRFNENQVKNFVHKIHPLAKQSSQKTYLKIFALLLLINRASDIETFVNGGFCDQMLPIAMKGNKVYLLSEPNTWLKCFEHWRSWEKENFESNQWKIDTPYFGPTENEILNKLQLWPQTRKPWRRTPNNGEGTDTETAENAGAYGTVTRVDIHPTSHSYEKLLTGINLECTKFAIKTLHTTDGNTKQTFQAEWDMLKRFSGLVHPHLVTVLGAFSQEEKWSFIFPSAACNLDQYLEVTSPPQGKRGAFWISDQIRGLTGALDTIHNPTHLHQNATKKYGRHGDIKCDNILCFKKSGIEAEKILVISDFGLSAFNSDKSRSNIPNGKVPPVPGYRPPECDIEGGTISRAFDIWTLGCLFLELITWFLGGYKYIEEFNDKRTTVFITGSKNDIFFALKRGQKEGSYVAQVKPEVSNWILKLRCHPDCSEFLHDCLDIIEQEMLVVLSEDSLRSPSGKLLTSFQRVFSRCRSVSTYTKGKPWTDNELRKAQEQITQKNIAVEAVPNENAQALLDSYKVTLPLHTGRTRKSLRADQLSNIDNA